MNSSETFQNTESLRIHPRPSRCIRLGVLAHGFGLGARLNEPLGCSRSTSSSTLRDEWYGLGPTEGVGIVLKPCAYLCGIIPFYSRT